MYKDPDLEEIIKAALEVKRLRAELEKAEAHLADVSNATTTWKGPKRTLAAPLKKAAMDKGSKPSLTDQVLRLVTGTRDAASITASLGLKASERRRVYDVLKKAGSTGRIKSLGDGKFGPRK